MVDRRSLVVVLVGAAVVALAATVGDYIWFEYGVRHRTSTGILHGALLLTTVGAVLGAAAGRLVAGLPLGAIAGIGGALAYYALFRVIGNPAMLAAWVVMWVLLAWLDGRFLRRDPGAVRDALIRGVLAAALSGLAFAVVVRQLWGHTEPGERDYLVQFGAWLLAWTPGLAALLLKKDRTVKT